jgi:hypothetical protein
VLEGRPPAGSDDQQDVRRCTIRVRSRTAQVPLVTLYVLFGPVRFFCVGCFCPYYIVAASDWSLDLFIGAAGRVVSLNGCTLAVGCHTVCSNVCCSTCGVHQGGCRVSTPLLFLARVQGTSRNIPI